MINFKMEMNPNTLRVGQFGGKRIKVAGGRAMFFKSKEYTACHDELSLRLKRYAPKEPIKGAVALHVKLIYPFLKNTPKYLRECGELWKGTSPDCDNLVKGLKDVMTELGYWKDDGQVARLIVEKVHAADWGIEIKVGAI